MSKHTFLQTIKNYFKELGLEEDQSAVLTELYLKNPQSVLQLSRKLQWGRNRIYRIIEELEDLQLITEVQSSYGSKFEPSGISTLERLVEDKKRTLLQAQKGLSKLLSTIPYLQKAKQVSSKVIHYHGINGLKQVNWNLIHTKGTYRVYEVSRLSQYLDKEFAETLRLEWLRRKIYSRDLTNDKEIEDWTDVTEFAQKYSEYRYIAPDILKIDTEIYIYNNVVAILQYDSLKYDPESIFCVEIYNQALADFQKQIFDILWNMAQPMKLLTKTGKRRVEE